MRVLLLHPDDSPRRGPWSRQRWDLIVDLGKSSQFSEKEWRELSRCPVLRSDEFRRGVEDVRRVSEIFSIGRRRLVDEEGIDWWDLTSLELVARTLEVLALRRVVSEIGMSAEVWATRSSWPVGMVAALFGRQLRSFDRGPLTPWASRVSHYAGLFQRFSMSQIKEIFLDKYDSSYRWRARFAAEPTGYDRPVVLVPSAYGNVSRTAAAYAAMLPEDSFLLVATRQSGKGFSCPANMEVRDLAAYARTDLPVAELQSLLERWTQLRSDLRDQPELVTLLRTGAMDALPGWLRDGLCARNAWRELIEREPVRSVLCGDDSNLYTRLPVLLAARKKIATVDFHHGAFDGRYLLKEMTCDVYLAKNEMERDYLTRVCGVSADKLAVGAASQNGAHIERRESGRGESVIFFSEPYEAHEMRGEEVYREVLPSLVRIARETGHRVIVKLHPFESPVQRNRLIRKVLTAGDVKWVTVRDGPLTEDLMEKIWFGITVESSAVMDCIDHGKCCFLCEWLARTPYEYIQQFARFGAGELLRDANEIAAIPTRLGELAKRLRPKASAGLDPALLRRWLNVASPEPCGTRLES